MTVVPPPLGDSSAKRPAERGRAVGQALQAAAGAQLGAADAVVADLDHEPVAAVVGDQRALASRGRAGRRWRAPR